MTFSPPKAGPPGAVRGVGPAWRAWSIAVATILSACSETSSLTYPRVHLGPEEVTPAMAAFVGPDGRFLLPSTVLNPPGQLDETQAKAIAERYVRDVARSALATWVAEHGAAVTPQALVPCDRALYAASPYASINGSAVSEITLRTFGPHWVIPMCGPGGDLEIVVSFSALAIELAKVGPATTELVPWERSEVRSFGVPTVASAGPMFSPEGAARHAFTTLGRRVNSVPELVMSPMPSSPVLVRWRLDLESPVTVIGAHSSATRERTTLLVGFADTFRSSGVLDVDPLAATPLTSWIDAVTRTPFTVVVAARAPWGVEIVTRRRP